jgi:pyrroline-5-carboxylate reductase
MKQGDRLGVIGGGVMGKALIQGILRAGLMKPEQLWAATKTVVSAQALAGETGVEATTHYTDFLPATNVILLCVKPGHVSTVLPHVVKQGLPAETVVISIAAGITTARMEELLGTANPCVRAMPNTPSVVGESMTVICGGTHTTPEQLEQARALFASVGRCRQVDEQHFNAITALSGSGPAYIYLIIEAMADAGVRVGLPRQLALDLVVQTVVGAARMVQTTGRHPAALRDDVTTPAGCTIGGLLMLEDGKIRSVLARAIEEATGIAGGLGQAKKN